MRVSLFVVSAIVLQWSTAITGCARQPESGANATGQTKAHEGGAGGDHHGAEVEELEPISITLFTPQLELFMEHPHLIQGEKATFLAHLTVLATGEPVRSGILVLEAQSADGKSVRVQEEAPARDGLFKPETVFPTAGSYAAKLLVRSDQAEETIELDSLIVHPDAHGAQHAAEALAGADPPDTVPFLMEQQWKISMLLGQVSKRTLTERLRIPGQIEAAQGASAAVSPPVAGRLVRVPGRGVPKIGETVQTGDTLAFIEPPLPVNAELTLRALDLDMKAVEVERSISETRQRLEYAKRAHERSIKLREKGAGSEQQYDEDKQNLELAQIGFDGAVAMKRYYDSATVKLNELRGHPGSTGPTGSTVSTAPATPSALRMPLVSPITGRIETAEHIEGEHVDAHQEVFRIVNTERVWVEGRISEFDLGKLPSAVGAYMTLPSLPDRRIDILGTAGGQHVAAGQVVDSVSRTLVIRYEMPNPDGLLRVGALVDLFLETNRAVAAVAIPEEAIVMEHGRPTSYVLVHGELFQKRELELGVRDGGFVEVKQGLNAGERVATKGAFAIKLAALSPASFSAGHAH